MFQATFTIETVNRYCQAREKQEKQAKTAQLKQVKQNQSSQNLANNQQNQTSIQTETTPQATPAISEQEKVEAPKEMSANKPQEETGKIQTNCDSEENDDVIVIDDTSPSSANENQSNENSENVTIGDMLSHCT